MRTPKSLPLLALIVLAGLVPAACTKKPNPPPVVPVATADAGDAGEAGAWGSMGSSEGGAPVASAEAGAPIASGSASASAAPSGSAIVPAITNEALDAAIDLAIKAQAAKDAAGMAAEGQPGRETLAENNHFNMLVTLQPNRCYTIFAFSPLGQVQQLDVKLLAPPLFNIEAGHSGANDKNAAVVGKGKQALCPILPIPVSYKIDVWAKKGSGRVGVYLYARNK
ncbi:MAG: hypothetical protein QM702_20895 [Rubrivivax sp.]